MRLLLPVAAMLCLFAACQPAVETTLAETNVRYGTWSDEKLFALLPEQALQAVCDFNTQPKVLDSLSSSYSQCTSNIMVYRGKNGFILKDNTTECQSIGRSDDLVYYDKSGLPVAHLVWRYLPVADLTMQTLILFEKGKYSAAYSRSAQGKEADLLSQEDFADYQPILGEERVDRYEL